MTQPTDPAAPAPSRTPRRLQQLRVLAVAALLLAMAVGLWSLSDFGDKAAAAPAVIDQSARLSQVDAALVAARDDTAQAIAKAESTSGSHARSATTNLQQAARQLILAAHSSPSDADSLAELSAAVTAYSQRLAAATTAESSAELAKATTALGDLQASINDLHDRLSSWAPAPVSPIPAALCAVLAIGVLAWVSWQLAQRSHRVLNLGVVGGIVAAAVIMAVVISAHTDAAAAVELSRDPGSLSAATAAAARVQTALAWQLALVAVAGGGGVVAVSWGIGQRLREYR